MVNEKKLLQKANRKISDLTNKHNAAMRTNAAHIQKLTTANQLYKMKIDDFYLILIDDCENDEITKEQMLEKLKLNLYEEQLHEKIQLRMEEFIQKMQKGKKDEKSSKQKK